MSAGNSGDSFANEELLMKFKGFRGLTVGFGKKCYEVGCRENEITQADCDDRGTN